MLVNLYQNPLVYTWKFFVMTLKNIYSRTNSFQAIGGNIMTASPISDLNPVFMAARCTLTLAAAGGNVHCMWWVLKCTINNKVSLSLNISKWKHNKKANSDWFSKWSGFCNTKRYCTQINFSQLLFQSIAQKNVFSLSRNRLTFMCGGQFQ